MFGNVIIEFEFDGDLDALVSSPSNFLIDRAGFSIPVDHVFKIGYDSLELYLCGGIRIPICLSEYYKKYPGEKVKMRMAF